MMKYSENKNLETQINSLSELNQSKDLEIKRLHDEKKEIANTYELKIKDLLREIQSLQGNEIELK